MLRNVFAFAALSAPLLLSACSSPEAAGAENGTVANAANALENGGAPQPNEPAAPANIAVDPVPPPDAVSHPDGYLPPAPGEPDPAAVNSSGPEGSPPATEDEYMRNRQSGR